MRDKILTPEQIDLYNQQHRAIFEAISSRDMPAAEKASIAHLELARDDLLGATR